MIFSPVMLLSAILVKITSSGPLIFKQERVGLHNEKFMMYKFRTMYVQTEEEEKKGWTQKNDPRVTKVGGFLRKTSLDEFPQLFNVLKGDMSLVGRNSKIYDQTSGASGNDRLGTGEWISRRYFHSKED